MEASLIITPVRRVLRDPDPGDRWTDATLLGYLYDAQLEIVRLIPGAYAVHETLKLTDGETRHAVVDADTIRIVGIERNMGGAQGPPGGIITETPFDALNKLNRAWAKGNRTSTITNYAIRPEDPLRFYVSPPATPDSYVEALLNKLPDTLDTTEDPININPGYKVILQLFTQGWALMEDTPGSDFPRGDAFVRQAYIALGFGSEEAQDGNR